MDENNDKPIIPADIRAYLEGILSDAGITPIDDNMQEIMLEEMYVRLDNYLNSIILDSIPPEKLEDFIKLNESGGTKEEIENFMKENVSDSEAVFADAFKSFKELYLGNNLENENSPSQNSTQN